MIFRYPGGKTSAREQIVRLLPTEMLEYREHLVGGGLFWEVRPALRRWITDIDDGLVAVYQALRDRPQEFLALCRSILPHTAADPKVKMGKQRVNARLLGEFERLLADEHADPALRYLYLNRHSRMGRVIYDLPSRTTYAHDRGWDLVWDDDLMPAAIKQMQEVRITHEDFSTLFCVPGNGVVIYADPPYFRSDAHNISQRLYAHEFTLEDHERLAAIAHKSPHRVLLSYNDCPAVRSLYRDWDVIETSWTYVGQAGARKRRGRELLIANYEISQRRDISQRMAALGKRTSDRKAAAARQNALLSVTPEAREKRRTAQQRRREREARMEAR